MGGFAYIKYNTTGIGYESHRLEYTPRMHLLRVSGCEMTGTGRGPSTVSVTLVNDGFGDASGVSGVLRTSTPGVSVTDSTALFPDLAPGASGSSLGSHFEVFLDGPEEGDWIEFELALDTDLRSSGLSFFAPVGFPQTVLSADFETAGEWTVGAPDDDATEGLWERAVPAEKRDPWFDQLIQPWKDHTPVPGEMCFVTENSPPGTKMRFGDVDGGKTTLLSPVFTLSGCSQALLSFAWWYSNDGIPTQVDDDPFDVDVSSDGGTTWTTVATVTETPEDQAWHRTVVDLDAATVLTSQMRVRFVAQDIGPYNSVVEAAVDDVEVLGFGDTTPAADGPIVRRAADAVRLFQNVPNPFNPVTEIAFALPVPARVDVAVYDVSGRCVRHLVDGRLAAGRHAAVWDGRDAAGTPVASGVYFYRLTAGDVVRTRRMILLQ